MVRSRVAIIGLDGMSWDVLMHYLEQLPCLRNIISRSFLGLLKCIPPLTPPSWTSILTGVKPQKHGILSFVKYKTCRENVHYRFYTSLDVKAPRLSEILAINGFFSLVINCPISYPLSGWYLERQIIVYDISSPKEFICPSVYERYLKYFKYIHALKARSNIEFLEQTCKLLELRTEGIEMLLEETNPDVLVLIVSETDTIMHRVPVIPAGKYVKSFLKILEVIDELLKIVAKKFDVIILVSDHGLRLFLKGLNISKVISDVESIKPVHLRKVLLSLLSTNMVTGLIHYALLTNIWTYKLAYKFRSFIRKFTGKRAVKRDRRIQRIRPDPIDAADAMILYFSSNQTMTTTTERLKYTLGKYIIEMQTIRNSDDLYAVYIVPQEGLYLNLDPLHSVNRWDILWFPSARHTIYGIFAWYEKGLIEKPTYIGVLNNTDVLPTILARLGLPIPSYTDGKVIALPTISKQVAGQVDYRLIRKLKMIRHKMLYRVQ